MPDREKVITTLAAIGIALDMDGHHKDAQAVRDAVKMLKEQEAVEPYRGDKWPKDVYGCGRCSQQLLDTGASSRPKYCPQCGKKVKWDE